MIGGFTGLLLGSSVSRPGFLDCWPLDSTTSFLRRHAFARFHFRHYAQSYLYRLHIFRFATGHRGDWSVAVILVGRLSPRRHAVFRQARRRRQGS